MMFRGAENMLLVRRLGDSSLAGVTRQFRLVGAGFRVVPWLRFRHRRRGSLFGGGAVDGAGHAGTVLRRADGDGDLDVLLTQIAGPPLLLRNDQQLGRHWLRFKLVGTRSNTSLWALIFTLVGGG